MVKQQEVVVGEPLLPRQEVVVEEEELCLIYQGVLLEKELLLLHQEVVVGEVLIPLWLVGVVWLLQYQGAEVEMQLLLQD